MIANHQARALQQKHLMEQYQLHMAQEDANLLDNEDNLEVELDSDDDQDAPDDDPDDEPDPD